MDKAVNGLVLPDLVSFSLIQIFFPFANITYLCKKISYQCYFDECSTFYVREMSLGVVRRQVIDDSPSVLRFTENLISNVLISVGVDTFSR